MKFFKKFNFLDKFCCKKAYDFQILQWNSLKRTFVQRFLMESKYVGCVLLVLKNTQFTYYLF
jgi:hypothetical protein